MTCSRVSRKRCAADQKWECRNTALGDANGIIQINVSKNSAMSSIVSQTEIGRASIYESQVVRVDQVPIATLDSMFAEFAGERVFLKVDTQGFEQSVLRGGANSLHNLLGVQLELPLIHLYEDTWKFDEALCFMREAGFTLSQLRPVTYYTRDPASLLEVGLRIQADQICRRCQPSLTAGHSRERSEPLN